MRNYKFCSVGPNFLRLFVFVAVVVTLLTTNEARSDSGTPTKIIGIAGGVNAISMPQIALNDTLTVKLDGTDQLDPTKYVLFLDGRIVHNLDDTLYSEPDHALVFHLRRNSDNASTWDALLGSPTLTPKIVSVALGEKATGLPNIVSDDPAKAQFSLISLPVMPLAFGTLAVFLVGIMIWTRSKSGTLLKDNLLPQMPPDKQTYSLARWQMAFWFTLIFATFLFLFVLLGDYNTLTPQSLTLMGISAATGLASFAVDATKNSPVDKANSTLRALGLNSYADVVRIANDIATRQATLKTLQPSPSTNDAQRTQLQTEIVDRMRIQRIYIDTIQPYVSQGWYHDLMTDINGPALHRVQVFFWTWVLGVVFVIEVYRNFAMPEFSQTLLALMAITGAGYVGFKYPETQN